MQSVQYTVLAAVGHRLNCHQRSHSQPLFLLVTPSLLTSLPLSHGITSVQLFNLAEQSHFNSIRVIRTSSFISCWQLLHLAHFCAATKVCPTLSVPPT
ncbi:hypothetical protein BCV70DRAFT_4926 [Testicularia cyperi]|uniref:Uncharacterized protein n=1 Tax=Testicularia cyperi TaxID=1882483 RepID=A0A317XZK0_9BASI|nr:hypothetical protein BCV70DRAFT_4926 [Testicularia cyperi]